MKVIDTSLSVDFYGVLWAQDFQRRPPTPTWQPATSCAPAAARRQAAGATCQSGRSPRPPNALQYTWQETLRGLRGELETLELQRCGFKVFATTGNTRAAAVSCASKCKQRENGDMAADSLLHALPLAC